MTDIGGGWYMEKTCLRTTTIKENKLSKKSQERQDEIQKKLYEANRLWNYWRFQLHCNKLEWVDPKSNPKIVKPLYVSSKKLYIIKSDRKAHFVVHYRLKDLDNDDFYKRKQVNEEMEAELIKTDSRPDNLTVSEDASVDEAVPIDIRKEGKKIIQRDNEPRY